ncbi:hypothetical protein [Kutzneria sp. NPDC051319]|uniref:hypothetical protein n=1 Tax=Kutzneria sp. NPDC051319 TaxID=3155047 RepID=UPI00341C062F
MNTQVLRAARELVTGDRVRLTDGTTVTVTDASPAGPPRLTWLELSNGHCGAIPSTQLLTIITA